MFLYWLFTLSFKKMVPASVRSLRMSVRSWSLKEWIGSNESKLCVCWSVGNISKKARQILCTVRSFTPGHFFFGGFLEVLQWFCKEILYIPYLVSSTSSYKYVKFLFPKTNEIWGPYVIPCLSIVCITALLRE